MTNRHILVAALLAVAVSPAAQALWVDDFTAEQLGLSLTNVSPPARTGSEVQATAGQELLGGYRDIYLTKTSTSPDGQSIVNVGLFDSGDGDRPILLIEHEQGVHSIGSVVWDGDTDPDPGPENSPTPPIGDPTGLPPISVSPTGLDSVDLTRHTDNPEPEPLDPLLPRANSFYFSLRDISSGFIPTQDLSIDLTMTVWSNGGTQQASASTSYTLFSTGILDQNPYLPFSSFAGVDFTQVSALQLDISSTQRYFAGIGFIDTRQLAVPEPATLGLAAAGLLGLGWSRRRA